jgi:hypothetical protein
MKKIATVVSSVFLLSGFSYAGAKTGIVIGGQVGFSELQNKLQAPSGGTVQNGNVSFGGVVGYDYALMKNFSVGLESGMNYNDQIATINFSNGSGANLNNYDVPILLNAKYYFGNFSIFAKAGYAYKHQKVKETGSLNDTFTLKKWIPVIGGGVGYDIMKNLTLYAQYTSEYGKNINDNSNWNAVSNSQVFASYSIMAGATYTFGM